MKRYRFVAIAILLLLSLPAISAHAQQPATPARPELIASTVGAEAPPVAAITPEGRLVVGWIDRSPELGLPVVYVAREPNWRPTPISLLPAASGQLVSLSLSAQGDRLAWTHGSPQAPILQSARLWLDLPIWEESLSSAYRLALAIDDAGRIHHAWAEEDGIHYTGAPTLQSHSPLTMTIAVDPTLIVSDLALAVDAQGTGHLAWSLADREGNAAGLYYSQLVGGAEPTRLAPSGSQISLRAEQGRAHLLWFEGQRLSYAQSDTWAPQEVATVPDQPKAADLALGSAGTPHIAWAVNGNLWYTTAPDTGWPARSLAQDVYPTSLLLRLDQEARPRIIWAGNDTEGNTGIYQLVAGGVAPQLAVTYPLAGQHLVADSQAQAVTNLLLDDILYVEFYLALDTGQEDGRSPLLHPLGVDQERSDGWGVPLSLETLPPARRYRVLALATTTEGEMLRATGDWFTAQSPQDEDLLWLRPQGPSTAVELMAVVRAPTTRTVELYLTPPHCLEGAELCPTKARQQPDAGYIGSYDLSELVPNRWQTLSLARERLPEGRYVAIAREAPTTGADTESSGEMAARAVLAQSRPFEIAHQLESEITITTPLQGDVIADRLAAEVAIEAGDESVRKVDFYLDRQYTLLQIDDERIGAPYALWLGSDTDARGGWRLDVAIDPGWHHATWALTAVAQNAQGEQVARATVGPLTLVPSGRTTLAFTRPNARRTLHGIESIAVRGAGGASGAVELYAEDHWGRLILLGEMAGGAGYWTYDWDTRGLADGTYTLVAIASDGQDRPVRARLDDIIVANESPRYTFRQPAANETLAGLVTIELAEHGDETPIQRMALYYRDEAGALYPVYDGLNTASAARDEGTAPVWRAHWETSGVLDGHYTLVAVIIDDAGRRSTVEQPVRVQQRTPDIVLLEAQTRGPWQGEFPIRWQATHPKGRPVTVSIDYSPDDGQHWLAVADAIPSQPGTEDEYIWDTTLVPDSTAGRLRLLVSAGAHHAQIISEPIQVNNRNQPPRVAFRSPHAGETTCEEIALNWSAWDPDGDRLRLSLDYREDEGTWQPLARNLRDETRYRWRPPNGDEPRTLALRLTATDPTGASDTAIVESVEWLPNRRPQVTLLWPNSRVQLDREAVILWHAQDADGDDLLIDLYYSDNAGQAWLPLAEGLSNTGYFVWQVSFLPQGTRYRIRVVARDGASQGIDDSDEVLSIGAANPPYLTLLAPTSEGDLSGKTMIEWSAFDPEHQALEIDLSVRPAGQQAWQTLASAAPDSGFALWDTTRWPDGSYDLRVTASDGIHTATDTTRRPLLVRNNVNHRPTVRLLQPRAGDVWSGRHEIRWEARDADGDPITATLSISPDAGQSWQELAVVDGRSGHHVWDTAALPSGSQYLLRVRVSDGRSSNHDTTAAPLVLANAQSHPPALQITSPDEAGTWPRTESIRWIAEDVDGDRLRLSLAISRDHGRTWHTLADDLADTSEYTLAASPHTGDRLRLIVDDGIHRVQARSAPLQTASSPLPQPEVRLHLPEETGPWKGITRLEWETVEAPSRPITVQLDISANGGQTWRTLADDLRADDDYVWDTRSVANGSYRLRLVATTAPEERTVTLSRPIVIENEAQNAPMIWFTAPQERVTWSGIQEIRWETSDPDGEPLHVTLAYSIDRGRSWQSLAVRLDDTGSYAWDTNAVPNCNEVWLRAQVSDGTYRRGAISPAPIAVRNILAPAVRLTVPEGGSQWMGRGLVRWAAGHATNATLTVTLEYSIDGGETWETISDRLPPRGSYLWDAGDLPDHSAVILRVVTHDGIQSAIDTLWDPIIVRNPGTSAPTPFYLR